MDSRNDEQIGDDDISEQASPDVPEFTKGIVGKSGGIPTVPLDVKFAPFNHFTMEAPSVTDGEYKEDPRFQGLVDNPPSQFDTFKAQAKHMNDTWHLLHATATQLSKPWNTPLDPDFDPKANENNFINIDPSYYEYLLDAKSDPDQKFRLDRIYTEQKNKSDIANGSWFGYLMGGTAGMVGDLTNLIPVMSGAKYSTYGKTIVRSILSALPGAAAYGAVSSAAEQLDLINGNLQDGLNDAFTRTIFGGVLFGVGSTLHLTADKLALWDLKGFAKDHMDGVGYKFKVDKSDKIIGADAYDMTGGSLSADKIKLAQDTADSTFSKTGLFKIPYLNDALIKLLGNKYFGSSIVKMLNSPYKTERAVADLSVDHGIITEGMQKGQVSPQKFFTLMKQTHAEIRMQEGQLNALYLERNGFDLSNYVAQGAVNAGLGIRDKIMRILGKELGDKPYIRREEFYGEIENVLHTETASAHAPVNEAAGLLRESMDKYYRAWRTTYNLPEDWMPPITAKGYLMRVYDTDFLNSNEGLWIRVVSDELKNQDDMIRWTSQPIKDAEQAIADHTIQHEALKKKPNVTDEEIKASSDELEGRKLAKTALEEQLQNVIRNDPNAQLLADDWHALSADEAANLKLLLKPRDVAQQKVNEIKEIISNLQSNVGRAKSASNKGKTVETAQKHQVAQEESERVLTKAKTDLSEAQKDLDREERILQSMAANGQVDRRFYSKPPNSEVYKFKDPADRLKFRKTYHEQEGYIASEEEAHEFRKAHAKAYFDTITHQTAEDTINQTMGKFTGNSSENHIKGRTLLVPDELLYKNKFMTKDLLAKVANYQTWLARRTHLKNVYNNVTLEGGFKPIVEQLHAEYQQARQILNDSKTATENKLSDANLSDSERKKLQKKLNKTTLALNKEKKQFDKSKYAVNFTYEKMAGISKLSQGQRAVQSAVRSATVAMNLGFLPLTMITDLSANGLKHGVLPFLRDGIYPAIQSLGGMLKTKDSQAFRHGCAALNLSVQHLGSAVSEKNIGLQTNPYLNMGKIPSVLDKVAHYSANFNLTNSIDNMLQRITSSVAQSEIVRIMHSYKAGKASARDLMWARRYGIDPKEWHARIIDAFKKDGGGKTALGGYQSNFWHWQDLEAANKVSDATFRATHDTIVSANTLDTPFWMDSNGPMGIMGPIFKGFNGYAFGSLNRYVIPMMQKTDATQLIGVLGMLAAGALVSPSRRMARGEDPYPPNMTDDQWMYEVVNDSAYFTYFMTVMNDANVLSGNTLMPNLRNDKYRDRSRAGLAGPAIGTANSMADFFTALASGEMNEYDALKFTRSMPFANATWTNWMSKSLVQQMGLPKTRDIAHRQKG